MSGTHFYLTLPSNASLSTFPDKTTTGYRVKLPQPIDLNGYWEVGLYSITYPRTCYTLQHLENHIYCAEKTGHFSSTIFDYGYYETMQDLIESINKALPKDNKEGKSGEVITRTFTNIQNVPVQKKSFEDVNIVLRDDTGNPLPFERGKLQATLHYRLQSSPYFT